ncbi:hypothetical protein AH4AK4_1243 [Aeromonas hydrophila 4AK4]|nr:hypothetical protein AH4AK4_1243 [Aeromonas hydrophila 4AK4]
MANQKLYNRGCQAEQYLRSASVPCRQGGGARLFSRWQGSLALVDPGRGDNHTGLL